MPKESPLSHTTIPNSSPKLSPDVPLDKDVVDVYLLNNEECILICEAESFLLF